MKHLGDITKINGYDAPVTDVVVGGSPCQDLSVAGKRAGLAGERSGLFMEQIRIIKEMRERDRNNGRADIAIRPRYGIWENVPGAFSSNGGQDFKAVIEEFVRVAEPEAPDVPMPQKGWPTSGCLFDEMGKWSVAWRVLDAQYWGVPQRRKRIALVADFNGLNAGTILFDPQYRRETERSLPDSSVRHTGGKSRSTVQPIAESVCGNTEQSESAGEATAGDAEDGSDGASSRTIGFQWQAGAEASLCIGNNIAPSISCTRVPAATIKAVGCDLYRGLISGDKTITLTTNANATGFGPTVIAVDQGGGKSACNVMDGLSPTLKCTHGGEPAICYSDAKAVDCRNFTEGEVNGTLQAKDGGGTSLNLNNVVRQTYYGTK